MCDQSNMPWLRHIIGDLIMVKILQAKIFNSEHQAVMNDCFFFYSSFQGHHHTVE